MFKEFIDCIDTHTEGDLTRFIMGGIPSIKGESLELKKEYFRKNFDYIRKFVMTEPRGHKDIFGAVITETVEDDSQYGLFFIEPHGYLSLCGHAVMASVVLSKKIGLIDYSLEEIKIDTPVGQVVARSKDNEEVEVESGPCFAVIQDEMMEVEGLGRIPIDIAFGGNFYAFVKAEDLGEKNIDTERAKTIGKIIRNFINNKMTIEHPEMKHIKGLAGVGIILPTDRANSKNITVIGDGAITRDPCETGTTAKIALEYAKGNLKINETYISEGILGTFFRGKAIRTVKVGPYEAVISKLSGKSYVTAFHKFVLEPNDPKPEGWLL